MHIRFSCFTFVEILVMKNKTERNRDEYKTVAEYAEMLGVTTQAIYARAKSSYEPLKIETWAGVKVINFIKHPPLLRKAGAKRANIQLLK